ncbi:unnamed protein product [Cyprideis torosa]|uniref:Uncharacterized protein n=1 Tax=Cyprideis torosa TaxID=163714 RepID=A0A7R8W294_9CRUS|nr:unnamed protein product [Cyprideis torosa]CAG0881718.1 unnamed protein product [Cyprideis torosa]
MITMRELNDLRGGRGVARTLTLKTTRVNEPTEVGVGKRTDYAPGGRHPPTFHLPMHALRTFERRWHDHRAVSILERTSVASVHSSPYSLIMGCSRRMSITSMFKTLVVVAAACLSCCCGTVYHDYCVIGAGPGGLQLGYYLQKAGRDYIIFEKNDIPGSFFVRMPRHRTLISINKRNTGHTNQFFNERHDWNSLLSDDDSLLFKHYSKEMFPPADAIVDYFRDYQQRLGINVTFGTDIRNVQRFWKPRNHGGYRFSMEDQFGNLYYCRFFVRMPRHRTLISINKRNTGHTNQFFNERHDWNSLLSDDDSLLFKHYSKEMFPPADAIVDYFRDYQQRLGINVTFGTDIRNVQRFWKPRNHGGYRFSMEDQFGNLYYCRVLITATGLPLPNQLKFVGQEFVEDYSTFDVDPEKYEGKTLLILGRGNSAFETADSLYGRTNLIHMLSRGRMRLAWNTHYVGDLRAVNNGILDTYQLKSLDGILEFDVNRLVVRKRNGKLFIGINWGQEYESPDYPRLKPTTEDSFDNFPFREKYDHIISCLGWKADLSIFNRAVNNGILDTYQLKSLDGILEFDVNRLVVRKRNGKLFIGINWGQDSSITQPYDDRVPKYPSIRYDFQSADTPDLYFAGTMSHALDFRKSAGGFIHGFRYTARALHRILEYRYHGNPWPSKTYHLTELLGVATRRVNEAAGLYQMYSFLGDVYILDENEFTILEEFPIKLLPHFADVSARALHRILEYRYHGNPWPSKTYPLTELLGVATRRVNEAAGLYQMYSFLGDVYILDENEFTILEEFPIKLLPHFADVSEEQIEELPLPDHGFTLPKPDRMHHIVEDFMAFWTAPMVHILPLRRFLDECANQDLRHHLNTHCFEYALNFASVPLFCMKYIFGQGLHLTQREASNIVAFHVQGFSYLFPRNVQRGRGTVPHSFV